MTCSWDEAALILTSGAPLPWDMSSTGQRRDGCCRAILEGLAAAEEADQKIGAGEIMMGASIDHGCVGPGAGTIPPPVGLRGRTRPGNRGVCAFYEGESRRRLSTMGAYGDDVADRLRFVH